ncbi:MAG: hypothetical protein AMXMBFR83_02860 [Phycisphaerae bacterium]
MLALDELGAGAGAVVILSNDGKHARRMVNDGTSPARWWVMGIVDEAGSVQERTNA